MKEVQTICIAPQEVGGRLDAVLAARGFPGLSRSRIKALIQQGRLALGETPVTDPSVKVRPGECYTLRLPCATPSALTPKAIPFGVVYEDEDLLVVDKPAGLTVHPAAGNRDHTLVNALLAYCGDTLSGIGGEQRPGIVHRLDKDTSGLMVVAKHDVAHQALSAQLADRSLSRVYAALVWGRPSPPKGTVDAPIGRHPVHRKKMAVLRQGGKTAQTHYETKRVFAAPAGKVEALVSLVECTLQTGRTHQIRVHMAHLGYPLVGDPVYGARRSSQLARLKASDAPDSLCAVLLDFPRQALHARDIGFLHPRSGEAMRFTCNLPPDLRELLDRCAAFPTER